MELAKEGVEMKLESRVVLPQDRTSCIPRLHKRTVDERISLVSDWAGLDKDDIEYIESTFTKFFPKETAQKFLENCFAADMAVISYAKINGKEMLIPASVEEPSIVAAASRGLKNSREVKAMINRGKLPLEVSLANEECPDGIEAHTIGKSLKGQIFLHGSDNPENAVDLIMESERLILEMANEGHRFTRATEIYCEIIPDGVLVYPVVFTNDVQGANVVNEMCEVIAPYIAQLTGTELISGILTNFADRCTVEAEMRVPIARLARPKYGWPDANDVCRRFLLQAKVAEYNIERATTHNKGIMNGVIAVGNATRQDTRALEAGAHSYAAKDGRYTALSRWREDGGYLVGRLTMPMAVGTVNGATGYPTAKLGLKILDYPRATELQEIMCAVGLANNYSAIQTLVTDGINRGHLNLHNQRFDSEKS